jgi:sigma-E factor negative regulatory protein RseA
MSDQQREHVSALVDGEIDDALLRPTLSALMSNSELSATWERYHLIGQALRGEPVRPDYRTIADRVRSQAAKERYLPAESKPRRHRPSGLSPFVGAALAASAAFVAVFAVPPLFDATIGSTASSPATAQIPASTRQYQPSGPGQRWHLEQPELRSKLDRFLVNHQAYSPTSGLKGFLPYATMVGYEAGR